VTIGLPMETVRQPMLVPGPAKKVTIHLNEDTISGKDYLSRELMAVLYDLGVAGATVLRPAAGFGSHHRLHKGGSGIDADQHMPLRIEFVESPTRVSAILPVLGKLVLDGMIEVQDTTIVKAAMADRSVSTEGEPSP
jgi:PII-like signaling protein